MTEILTERLRIRCMAEKDVPAIVAILNVWEVNRWLARPPFPYTEKDALELLMYQRADHAHGDATAFLLAERASDRPIGTIDVRVDEHGVGTLGYWLDQRFWRQGYMTEASSALVAHVRTLPIPRRLMATVELANRASLLILTRLGFVQVGRKALAAPSKTGALERLVFAHPDWSDWSVPR